MRRRDTRRPGTSPHPCPKPLPVTVFVPLPSESVPLPVPLQVTVRVAALEPAFVTADDKLTLAAVQGQATAQLAVRLELLQTVARKAVVAALAGHRLELFAFDLNAVCIDCHTLQVQCQLVVAKRVVGIPIPADLRLSATVTIASELEAVVTGLSCQAEGFISEVVAPFVPQKDGRL